MIICPTLSIFRFVIREKKKFFYEVPRLLAHPLPPRVFYCTIDTKAFINQPLRVPYCSFYTKRFINVPPRVSYCTIDTKTFITQA